jgi:hypothetical protein
MLNIDAGKIDVKIFFTMIKIVPYAPALDILFWIDREAASISLTTTDYAHEKNYLGDLKEFMKTDRQDISKKQPTKR